MHRGGQRGASGRKHWRLISNTAALAALFGILLLGHPAGAQPDEPDPGPSAADKETARHLMNVGDQKFEAGNYRGALDDYLAADKIMGVPTTGIEVGRAQEKLHMLVEARDTWLRVARYPRHADEPAPFTRARAAAGRLANKVAARIPTIRVEVSGVPQGTAIKVSVDRVMVPEGTHRHPRKVNPGNKLIEVFAEGFVTAQRWVTVREREEQVVQIALEPLPPPPPPKPPPPPEPETHPMVWVGFGVGAAGLALGTTMGILSMTATSDAADQCDDDLECPQSAEEDVDRAIAFANVSNVGFGVAALGVAVGVIFLLTGDSVPEQSTEAGLVVQPSIGPGGVGLRGQF